MTSKMIRCLHTPSIRWQRPNQRSILRKLRDISQWSNIPKCKAPPRIMFKIVSSKRKPCPQGTSKMNIRFTAKLVILNKIQVKESRMATSMRNLTSLYQNTKYSIHQKISTIPKMIKSIQNTRITIKRHIKKSMAERLKQRLNRCINQCLTVTA